MYPGQAPQPQYQPLPPQPQSQSQPQPQPSPSSSSSALPGYSSPTEYAALQRQRRKRIILAILAAIVIVLIFHLSRRRHHKSSDRDDSDYGDDDSLKGFYDRHVQCRSCLSDFSNPDRPSFVSSKPKRWCPTVGVSADSKPANDFDGKCQAFETGCADGSKGITATNSCAQDEPATKLTCSSCVLDSYTWCSGRHAEDRGDEYDGKCVSAGRSSASDNFVCSSAKNSISDLSGCQSIIDGDSPMSGRRHGFPLIPIIIVAMIVAFFLRWRKVRRMRAAAAAAAPALASSPPAFAALPVAQPVAHPVNPPAAPVSAPVQSHIIASPQYFAPPAAQVPRPAPVSANSYSQQPRSMYPNVGNSNDEIELNYIRMNDQSNYPNLR